MQILRWPAALVFAALGPIVAPDTAPPDTTSAPFEIVRSHTDIDVNGDGSYVRTDETALRVLDSRGPAALRQTILSYTEGLQSLEVQSAYTLKASGKKIPVEPDQIMSSRSTAGPGFEDIRTLTIGFPRLGIGDEIVLATVEKQLVPPFAGQFAVRQDFGRAIKSADVQVTLTSPKSGLPLKIEAVGVEGGQPADYGEKVRRVWQYHNDAPVTFPPDSVAASDDQPHLIASSFPSYEAVGQAYGGRFAGKSEASPEIESLADRITRGISDRRAEAKALYEWVANNIFYVNIAPESRNFTPRAAADILVLRFGDSMDHVMLLEALLAAKGIPSNPALIAAGGAYALPSVPSPLYFNHLITYVPELGLFLDSSAHDAPFGILPPRDTDRPVVLVPSGAVLVTPDSTADQSTSHAAIDVRFDADGTANGVSQIALTGTAAIDQREIVDAIPPEREKEMFQLTLGPGSEASIDRGNLETASDPFAYVLHYRVPNAASFSGAGAVSTGLGIGPFAAASMALDLLPDLRPTTYACPSMTTTEDSIYEFPPNVDVTSVPKPVSITAEGIRFEMHYEIKDPHTVTGAIMLRSDHPRAFCTPDYYAKVRADLGRIAASLRGQILYK